MLYFLTEHTLTEHTLSIYVQYIKGSKRKTSSLREIVRERFSIFCFRQHF